MTHAANSYATNLPLRFKRFTLNQRIEHIIFFATFILLAYTGFPLKFPDQWWSQWMIASVGGFDNRTLIHHFSGLLMIGVAVYHAVYHVLEKPRFDIIFSLDDVKQFIQQIKYCLKITNERPQSGRYTWKQKFEYFGAGFGAVVMGLTGILMWKPFEAMQYFPIGFVQIANLFHTWEAVLASLAVFIGHVYDEHLTKFPNKSWITGNVSEEEMVHEHPAEYYNVMSSVNIDKLECEVEINDDNRNPITSISRLIVIAVFLVISAWMLWISYQVLVEAVNTYL